MVIYQSGSLYEHFLLSGRGAEHYDAAKELEDGIYMTMWFDPSIDERLLNSTSGLLLPKPANYPNAVSDPPFDSLKPSPVWRLSKKNKK